jgi:hypothetical protein
MVYLIAPGHIKRRIIDFFYKQLSKRCHVGMSQTVIFIINAIGHTGVSE